MQGNQAGGTQPGRASELFPQNSWLSPTGGDSIFEMSLQNSLPPHLKIHSWETEGTSKGGKTRGVFLSSFMVIVNSQSPRGTNKH